MRVVIVVIKRFFIERFFDQAAQTAYYLLVSMLPFLMFTFSVLSLLTPDANIVLDLIEPVVPADAFLLIEKNILFMLNRTQGNFMYISLIAAFWLSSMAVQSFGRSLDLAHGYERKAMFWQMLIRDLGITLLFMLVIPLTLFLPPIDEAMHRFITETSFIQIGDGWAYTRHFIRWGLGSLFLFSFFLLFYKIVPSGKVSITVVWPGALCTTLIWQVFSLTFGRYVTNVDYTILYGQLSSIIVLVLWFYFTAVIILCSGLINAELQKKNIYKG